MTSKADTVLVFLIFATNFRNYSYKAVSCKNIIRTWLHNTKEG